MALIAAGCGAPGDPLPPSLNIPQAITDLAARQQGDRILVTFTLPALTTDGVVLRKFQAVELRAGPPPEGNFDLERWAEVAKVFPVTQARPGPVELAVPVAEWGPREIILGVRAAGPKGRFSEWSNLVALTLVPPLAAPEDLRAQATAEGVRLEWRTPDEREGLRFRIFRRGAGQSEPAQIGESQEPAFIDANASLGLSWQYRVQAVIRAGETEAFSEPSPWISITPEDRFPPSPPKGLRATASLGSVELAWEANQEPDLKGYYVWRAAPDQSLQRLSDLLTLPSYSDRTARSGVRYRYAISAVDTRGNESALSSPVEVIAP